MLWLAALVMMATAANCSPGYRLPGNIRPLHYILELKTNLEEPSFNFSGEVWIKIECEEPTQTVILHSSNLKVDEGGVTVKEILGTEELGQVRVDQVKLVPENDFLVVKLEEQLKQGKSYIVHVGFSGDLTQDLAGFYRSSYTDRQENKTRWLAVTQFQPIFARRAFPCFDEPEMKARFTIRLAHKKDLLAVSNMPLDKVVPFENEEGWVWSHFQDTLTMSTYLVAFLISDFAESTSDMKPNNVTFRILSRKGAIDQTEFARKVGPDVLEYFEEYFEVKFPLPKQDMAAIPDFSAGAMENWGLVTYREVSLLYDEKSSPKVVQHEVANVIAHELSHQWFGNLVTMKWWSDLWLNEGFATYVGTLGVEKLFPEWNFLEEKVMDYTHSVYDSDSLKSSHPVSVEIGHPLEISQIFGTISYIKGCLILRMIHLYLGDSFKNGVIKYLKKHQFGNAEQNDLWEALTTQAQEDGNLDMSPTVKEVMDTWTLQTGYPLLTVSRDYEKGTATFQQRRYLQVEPGSASSKDKNKEPCWWIPITYTTQDKADFKKTSPQLWLNCANSNSSKLEELSPDAWLIMNIKVAGLYRVNYDEKNWRMISDSLNSDNFKEISPMNRADILLSVFDFAMTGDVTYDVAFSIAGYLERETAYLPWKTGLSKLGGLASRLSSTANYGKFESFMRRLLKPIYKNYSKLVDVPIVHEEIQLHTIINKWAIDLELGDSLKQVQDLFSKWMASPDPDKENLIPQDFKGTVYCKSVWFGGSKTWDLLWQRYLESNFASEKIIILSALGCSRDIWILNRYLEWSIDVKSDVRKQDSASVFMVIAAHNVGYYVACDFFQRRIKDIYDYLGGTPHNPLGIYVAVCVHKSIFEDEYKKWKDFLMDNKDYLKDSWMSVEKSLEMGLANINWYKKNYEKVSKILSA